jgi:Type II secretory pathway, component PulF
MPFYSWSGITQDGKKTQGLLFTKNLKSAKNELLIEKIFPLKLTYQIKLNLCKIRPSELVEFIERFSMLISANLTIVKALEITKQSEKNHLLKSILNDCQKTVLQGTPLSKAWKKYSPYFTELHANLLAIGEQTGELPLILQGLASYSKKMLEQQQKISRSLIYPAIIASIGLTISIIFLIFIVPQLAQMFSQLDKELPYYTKQIIKLSNFLINWGKLCVVVSLAILIIVKLLYKAIKKNYDLKMLLFNNLPLLKQLYEKITLYFIVRTLNLSIKAGIPLLTSLGNTLAATKNAKYQKSLKKIILKITAGESLYQAFKEQLLFPSALLQLLKVGEETGDLEAATEKITLIYESQLNEFLNSFNRLIEPTITIILGILIASLAIAMYLPIFQLGSSI